MKKEYEIGEMLEYKNQLLRVEESEDCTNCFFNKENYPYKNSIDCICFRNKDVATCSMFDRSDKKEIIYRRLSEIEVLILKGDKNEI